MVLASRSKRARKSAFLLRCAGSTLIAISRPNRESRARYTSPMPPAPSGATISYGPNFVPALIPILARDYTPPRPLSVSAVAQPFLAVHFNEAQAPRAPFAVFAGGWPTLCAFASCKGWVLGFLF